MPALHVILASTRPVSNGRPVGEWFAALAAAYGFDITLVDLAEIGLPLLDEPEMASTGDYRHQHTKQWSALIGRADAVVWVMPMYNGGFGAAQKNAIDFLYREWRGKPVGLVSYSGGSSGGRPAAEMLTPILTRIGMRPTASGVAIANVGGHVDEERRFEPTAQHAHEAEVLLDELAALLRTQTAWATAA
jgi:NAD(P)H-dependent FMN reductase